MSVQGVSVLVHSGWCAAGAELAAGTGDRGAGREGPGTVPAATGSAPLPQSLERPGLVGGAGTPERAVAPTQSPSAPRGPPAERGGLGAGSPHCPPSALPRFHVFASCAWVCSEAAYPIYDRFVFWNLLQLVLA